MLFIAGPEQNDEGLDFGGSAYVYELYFLLRSYVVLQGREHLSLPDDTQVLIEAVYGEIGGQDLSPEWSEALAQAKEEMRRHREQDALKAIQKLVASPDAEGLLQQQHLPLEEDEPALHETFQALTRLMPPGVSLVCLHQTPKGVVLDPEGGTRTVDLTQKPSSEMVRELAWRTVNVTYPTVRRHFVSQAVPSGWVEHALLHDHRVAIFVDGICRLEGTRWVLRLTRELGLEIVEEA